VTPSHRDLLTAGAALLLLAAPALLVAQPPASGANVCAWDFLRPSLGQGSWSCGGAPCLSPLEAERTLVDNLDALCTGDVAVEDFPTGLTDDCVLEAQSGAVVCGTGAGLHAPTHHEAAADELLLELLGTAELDTTDCLLPDGAGGVTWSTCPGGGTGAPEGAEYLVGAADPSLTDERVLVAGQNTTPDLGTAGEAAIDVPDASTTTRGAVELATDGENAAGLAVQADDVRLSNARAPTAHAPSHQDAGADELDLTGLPGTAADRQPVTVEREGVEAGTRPRINFLEGSNVTISAADDGTDGEVDVTISAATTGGTVVVEEVDGAPSVTASTIEFDETTGLTVTDQGAGIARVSSAGGGDSPYTGVYHPDRPPTSGLAAASSDEFTGAVGGSWAWGNQGSATDTAEMDTALLDAAEANGDFRVRWIPAPASGDFVVATKVTPLVLTASNDNCDLMLLASGTIASPTSLTRAGFAHLTGTSVQIDFSSFTSYALAGGSAHGSAIGGFDDRTSAFDETYLAIKVVDATDTATAYYSRDGVTWRQVGSAATLAGYPTQLGRSARRTAKCRYHWVRTITDAGKIGRLEIGE